jgi:hypothetical protein
MDGTACGADQVLFILLMRGVRRPTDVATAIPDNSVDWL